MILAGMKRRQDDNYLKNERTCRARVSYSVGSLRYTTPHDRRSSKQIDSVCKKKKTNNFLSQARVFSIRSSFFIEFFCMEQHFERESKKDATYPKFRCSYKSWLTKVRSCFSSPERT